MKASGPGPYRKEHTHAFAGGETIFTAGDPGGSVFLVLEGRVKITKEIDGASRTLGVLDAGEFFGEMSFLEELPRSATAIALTDCSLLELNTEAFEESLAEEPELAVSLLRSFSRRLRQANRRIATLMTRDKMMRLLDYLLDTVVKEADITDEGLVVDTGGDPLDYLAAHCALEREEVEEMAAILRDREIISLAGSKLILKGFTPLKRLRTYLQLRSEFGSFL
jgi:CRP/FNR family transcriptional regulator